MSEWIYLLHEREFIKTGENIYKIGRTSQENCERFRQYPKGSKILLNTNCDDSSMIEAKIIKLFCEKYHQCRNIGREYFRGDYESMKDDINNIIKKNGCKLETVLTVFDDVELNKLLMRSLDEKLNSRIELIYYLYEELYNYGEDGNWYMYKNYKWEKIGKTNYRINNYYQDKINEIYTKALNYYENQSDFKNILQSLIDKKDDISTKNKIMKDLCKMYSSYKNKDNDFVKNLDQNPNLIGFNNGIYDLKSKMFLTKNLKEHITKNVKYDYNEKYSEKKEDLMCFLREIIPKEEELKYLLTYLSNVLVGESCEYFTIFVGSGQNGKSRLIELIELTLGEYCCFLPTQLYTEKYNDKELEKEILVLKNNKISISEMNPEKKINMDFIKCMIKSEAPKNVPLIVCKNIPECINIDTSIAKQLRCINFATNFVENPKKENEKKRDEKINKKFELWKHDLMLLLIEYYHKSEFLKATENNLLWMNQYEEKRDIFMDFLDEKTIATENENIHCSILRLSFIEWLNDKNDKNIPSNKEFVAKLKKYKEITNVKVDGKTQLGVKKLKLSC